MKKHRTYLLRLATNLSSREAGFVFALLGVFVQAAHTWFLAYDLSSLPGIWRLLQAGLMALFISAALLYFTLKSSDEDTPQAKKYRRIVWWFACVETFINLYYWGDHLLIKPWPNPDYGSFIIAIPFSILLPFVLKSYGSEVRTEDYSELDEDVVQESHESQQIATPSPELVEYVVNELKKSQDKNKDKYFERGPIPMKVPDEVEGKETTATTDDIQQSEESIYAQESSSDAENEPEHIQNKEDIESNPAAITSNVENIPEQVQDIEEELLPPSSKNPQDEVVPVYDAQGNNARISDESSLSQETVVSKPTFSGTPEIKNGTFASIPAYVKNKQQ